MIRARPLVQWLLRSAALLPGATALPAQTAGGSACPSRALASDPKVTEWLPPLVAEARVLP